MFQERKKHINIKKHSENLPMRIPPSKLFMWGFFSSWKKKEKRPPPHIKNWRSQIFMLRAPSILFVGNTFRKFSDPSHWYFLKSIFGINGRCAAVQIGGVLRDEWEAYCGVSLFQCLKASKTQCCKWRAYGGTNFKDA